VGMFGNCLNKLEVGKNEFLRISSNTWAQGVHLGPRFTCRYNIDWWQDRFFGRLHKFGQLQGG
jgi:hypothetical protein